MCKLQVLLSELLNFQVEGFGGNFPIRLVERVHQDFNIVFVDLGEEVLDVFLVLGVVEQEEFDV